MQRSEKIKILEELKKEKIISIQFSLAQKYYPGKEITPHMEYLAAIVFGAWYVDAHFLCGANRELYKFWWPVEDQKSRHDFIDFLIEKNGLSSNFKKRKRKKSPVSGRHT